MRAKIFCRIITAILIIVFAVFELNAQEQSFDFVIKTTAESSTFTFIIDGAENMVIDWGVGAGTEPIADGDRSPSNYYESTGTYTISLTGKAGRISFSGVNGYTPHLLRDILTPVYPGVTGITSAREMFAGAENITEFTAEDFFDVISSSVTDMRSMFKGAAGFNQDISSWDVSNSTSMRHMFNGASAFDRDISGWNIREVSDFTGFLSNSGFSTENYDKLLIAWSELDIKKTGVNFGAEGIKYSLGAPEAAREKFRHDWSWEFEDGDDTGELYKPPFRASAISRGSIRWEWDLIPGATYYRIYSCEDILLSQLHGSTGSWVEDGLDPNTPRTRYLFAGGPKPGGPAMGFGRSDNLTSYASPVYHNAQYLVWDNDEDSSMQIPPASTPTFALIRDIDSSQASAGKAADEKLPPGTVKDIVAPKDFVLMRPDGTPVEPGEIPLIISDDIIIRIPYPADLPGSDVDRLRLVKLNLENSEWEFISPGRVTIDRENRWVEGRLSILSVYSLVSLAKPSFRATALSTSSIRWEWDLIPGSTYYRIYSCDDILISQLDGSTGSWVEGGVEPNTPQTRYLEAGGSGKFLGRSDNLTAYASPVYHNVQYLVRDNDENSSMQIPPTSTPTFALIRDLDSGQEKARRTADEKLPPGTVKDIVAPKDFVLMRPDGTPVEPDEIPLIISGDIIIRIHYPAGLPHPDVDRLRLAKLNQAGLEWEFLPPGRVTIDSEKRWVEGRLDSLSIYTLLATAYTGTKSVYVYPNPLKPGDPDYGEADGGGIIIGALPPSADIRVFNIAGELIDSFSHNGSGSYHWAGAGKLASGVYILAVSSGDSFNKVKFAVVR